jgi:P4 family phage/plasmid primase-like protien
VRFKPNPEIKILEKTIYVTAIIRQMSVSLEQFLSGKCTKDTHFTHVSMVRPLGKINIEHSQRDKFFELYQGYLREHPKKYLGLGEVPQSVMPIVVDIDLKVDATMFSDEIPRCIYTTSQLDEIVHIYQEVLRIILDVSDKDLACVVLEKPPYPVSTNGKTFIKNGFHLHFPRILLDKSEIGVQLLPRVRTRVKERDIFASLGITDSSTVVDGAVTCNCWLMYKCVKAFGAEPYRVTRVVDAFGEPTDLQEAFGDLIFKDSLGEELRLGKLGVKENLPRLLSMVDQGRTIYEIKPGIISPLKVNLLKTNPKATTTKYEEKTAEENLDIARKLLEMLSVDRCENYSEWMRVGWILHNIGNGANDFLELWLEFSSRSSDKYNESECLHIWSTMQDKGQLGMGTLRYMALTDNPDAYKQFKRDMCKQHAAASLNGSHWDIAKALHAMYSEEFVCGSVNSHQWYQYKNHHWEEIEDGVFLRLRISQELVARYQEMLKESEKQLAASEGNAGEEAKHRTNIALIRKIISSLKSAPYKKNVMREAMDIFYNGEFRQVLDQNTRLLGFKNGVYELNTKIFRPGTPEDYISKCMPIEYNTYHPASNEVLEIEDFLEKVFPNKDIRTYFLDTYSEIFVGGNTQKKIYIWTGEGDNAKSVTQNLFEMMLGPLSIKFNTQYFTGKKVASGSANPELSRAAPPVRMVTMDEPDGDEQLNNGELKKLSGGDKYWARDLFETGKQAREVTPMFTMTLICNGLPKLRNSDKATWNRLRVIPFESTFVDKGAPIDRNEQMRLKRFPMDREFGKKLPKMVPVFAWYLLEWRKRTKRSDEPTEVLKATEKYQKENDIYYQFIKECINIGSGVVSVAELYSYFKEWFKEGWPNTTVPIKNTVKESFEKKWGEPGPGLTWRGYSIRSLDENIEQGKAIILEPGDLFGHDKNEESKDDIANE